MRLADASLAAACLVQLFTPAWGWPQPDQLVSYIVCAALPDQSLLMGVPIQRITDKY